MNGSRKQARSDEELMRGAYAWALELSEDRESYVSLVLGPSDREGVWIVAAREHWVEQGKPLGIRRQYTTQWPSSQYQTLAGAVYAALGALDAAPVQEKLPWLSA